MLEIQDNSAKIRDNTTEIPNNCAEDLTQQQQRFTDKWQQNAGGQSREPQRTVEKTAVDCQKHRQNNQGKCIQPSRKMRRTIKENVLDNRGRHD